VACDTASFRDDFIVFAMCSRRKNDKNAVARLRQFLAMAMQFGPVNLGDARHGRSLRPSRSMSPLAQWQRSAQPDFRAVIEGLDTAATAAAVFDNRPRPRISRSSALRRPGFERHISTSIHGAEPCCHAAGLCRHSVGYSLEFEGKPGHLPNQAVLMLSHHVRSWYGGFVHWRRR
jgi:hypothetical protein